MSEDWKTPIIRRKIETTQGDWSTIHTLWAVALSLILTLVLAWWLYPQNHAAPVKQITTTTVTIRKLGVVCWDSAGYPIRTRFEDAKKRGLSC